MKIIVLFSLAILTLANLCYSQSGWFTQNSNTTNELRDVQFINSQTGWTVGFYSTIRKTTNGGLSWFSQYTPGTQDGYICCYFTNELTGWVGGGSQTQNQSYIYKTTNGGNNWMSQYNSNSGIIMKLWFLDSLKGWAAGAGGKILSTTNGGQTWISKTSGTSLDLVSIFFVNESLGWICGKYGTILRTTTGGAIWSPYYSGITQDLEAVTFISSMTGFAVGRNGTILKSTNGGETWVIKYLSTAEWINSVFFIDNNTGWASGGTYGVSGSGQILKTTNAGENWLIQTIPSVPWLADIQFITPEIGWAVGSNGTIIFTTNGGLSVPNAPTLIFPLNNAINVPINTTFRWSQVSSAQHYTIQISTVPNFAVLTDSITVDTNLYNIQYGKLTNALTYFWRVNASNLNGTSPWSTVWIFSTLVTGISTLSNSTPTEFKVYDSYPNPFNPTTKIKFDIPKATSIKMYIYDMAGRQVDKLFEGNISAGTFEYIWNAEKFNSGVYIMRFVSNEYNISKKLMLIK